MILPRCAALFRIMCMAAIFSYIIMVFYLSRNSWDPTERKAVKIPIPVQKLRNPTTPDEETTSSNSPTTTFAAYLLPESESCVRKPQIMSQQMILDEVEKNNPSLPIAFWNKRKTSPMFYKNESCAKFPRIYDLEFHNNYWQCLYTSHCTFYLFRAYYDVRQYSKIGPVVRILAMINRKEPTVKTYCQFWFESQKEPVITEVMGYVYIWTKYWVDNRPGRYEPYLISCKIPETHYQIVPASVSLVEKQCDTAINILRVIYNKPKKKKFAICVKNLNFLHYDNSVRLVEWIELMGILGADKLFFYELHVHPNISKVLQYYQKLGRIDVTPLTLPGGEPNAPGIQHMYLSNSNIDSRLINMIAYNDCLYKNIYSYEYLVLLDTDEVIMPVNAMSWKELMEVVLPKARAKNNAIMDSYNVRNVYFFDNLPEERGWTKDIPRYMHMLQHVYRSEMFTEPFHYVKSFQNPENILTTHNHMPLECLDGACHTYSISTDDAQMHHYRSDCVLELKNKCHKFRGHIVDDTTIWKFKEELITRIMDTLNKLGFFCTCDAGADVF